MNENTNEHFRKLNELALQAGKKRVSKYTKLVHISPENNESGTPIPIYENLLFCLALFRSKTAENILEGRQFLEKILHFQNKNNDFSHGNFPTYLHEYPICNDRALGILLLPIFYWLLKHFRSVLSHDLAIKIEKTCQEIIDFSTKTLLEQSFSYPITLKFAAAKTAFGDLLSNSLWKEEGKNLLNLLLNNTQDNSWHYPETLGDLVISLQMVDEHLSSPLSLKLAQHLKNIWHSKQCAYIGIGLKEFQEGLEPQVTLLDLIMGAASGTFSSRGLRDHLVHLSGSLIQPFKLDQFISSNFNEGILTNLKQWKVFHGENASLSILETETDILNPVEKGVHALKIIWGTPQHLHTFVCQGGNAETRILQVNEKEVTLLFSLKGEVNLDGKDKNREVSFFLDLDPAVKILVEDQFTTTFLLNQKLTLETSGPKIKIDFSLYQGSGDFIGHIMRGNRPSQIAAIGSFRYEAYDWQFFLRTLRRSSNSVIKVNLKIE